MLDLQKYLAMAEADPGFRARLFENANQAIKDEFGEDLPYKLKCREKLVFEVEPMEGLLSDDSWENVAGGSASGAYENNSLPVPQPNSAVGPPVFDPRFNPNNAIYERWGNSNIPREITKSEVENSFDGSAGLLPENDLSDIAGGSAGFGPVPTSKLLNDENWWANNKYRQRHGFVWPPFYRPDNPDNSSRNDSPFVRFKDDSGIQTFKHDVRRGFGVVDLKM